jgi:spore maturation protein CgeB
MRILVIDSYYSAFLKSLYEQHLDLAQRPYDEQLRTLMDQCFGTGDFYSRNLIALGHESTEIVANCEPLQRAWAGEQGVKLQKWALDKRAGMIPWLRSVQDNNWFYTVLAAQVKQYRPDVLYLQDINGISAAFLREVRPYVKLIAGQIACPISSDVDFREYDLVLSSLPHYVRRFRAQGLSSQLFRLGFESAVLEKLTRQSSPHQVVHIGGYGPIHRERNELLESLTDHGIPLICWGYGINHLSPSSSLHGCYQGEAWGLQMYNIRLNSRICVSKHVSEVADVYANIMTLYEATGVGTLLMIDQRDDLATLFEPGKEVIAYNSAAEAAELIEYYLTHEEERQAIAQAGQARTLREHTYRHRMEEFVGIVKRYLP